MCVQNNFFIQLIWFEAFQYPTKRLGHVLVLHCSARCTKSLPHEENGLFSTFMPVDKAQIFLIDLKFTFFGTIGPCFCVSGGHKCDGLDPFAAIRSYSHN